MSDRFEVRVAGMPVDVDEKTLAALRSVGSEEQVSARANDMLADMVADYSRRPEVQGRTIMESAMRAVGSVRRFLDTDTDGRVEIIQSMDMPGLLELSNQLSTLGEMVGRMDKIVAVRIGQAVFLELAERIDREDAENLRQSLAAQALEQAFRNAKAVQVMDKAPKESS